jgi:hypothetical protein
MRYICLIASTLLLVSCASSAPLSTAHAPSIVGEGVPPCMKSGADGQCDLYDASFIQLVSRPEVYNGKRIFLIAFVNLEFEGNAAYLSEELQRHGSSRDAVWLDLTDISRAPTFRRGYARVEGTFTAGSGGHFGMFAGTISRIQRLEEVK